jgi:UDP-3-O-[3-hydroxymyristoyl] glucosamine N-acyltransferase
LGQKHRTTHTASEIATICGATLEGDGSVELVGYASLREAEAHHVSFLGNPLYKKELEATRAGAVLLQRGTQVVVRRDLALLFCDEPNAAFTRVIEAFLDGPDDVLSGISPAASVDRSARLAADVAVGACAVIGPGAEIAAGAVIHPGAVVGARASVGEESVLHPGVVLYPGVSIGARCVLHAGTVVGSDGFGFDPSPKGWSKVPQWGSVVVEDDVEIGANCTIDRARFGATRIGRGAKLDNLVHVGHNVEVGPGVLLVAQVGVSGSVRIGERSILAGKVGVTGHVVIGPGARIAGASMVTKSLPGGEDYLGNPASPKSQELRLNAAQRRVPELKQALRALSERVAKLEEKFR